MTRDRRCGGNTVPTTALVAVALVPVFCHAAVDAFMATTDDTDEEDCDGETEERRGLSLGWVETDRQT